MATMKLKWGVTVTPIRRGSWSVGVALTHNEEETYLCINLFKWTISIGRIQFMDMSESVCDECPYRDELSGMCTTSSGMCEYAREENE